MSEYFFTTSEMKGRVVASTPPVLSGDGKVLTPGWYVCEWKPNTEDGLWFPYLCGTAEFLGLSEQDLAWAAPPKKKKKE